MSRVRYQRGLSLLEVILAIAILGVALATIGQLVRLGSRNAAAARDLMTAQIHCESKLNEVAAGAADMNAVTDAPLDEYGEWVYSVESVPIDDAGLIEIRVTVSQAADAAARPVNYTLTRWMIAPAVIEAAEAEAAAMKEQAAAAAAQGEQNAAEGAGTPDPTTGGNAGGNNNGGTPGGGPGLPNIPGAPGGFGPGGAGGPAGAGGGPGGPRGGNADGDRREGRGRRGGGPRGGFGGRGPQGAGPQGGGPQGNGPQGESSGP